MPRELVVRTPENVEITHSLAGIGSRFMAVFIDHLLQALLLILLLLSVLFLIGGVRDWLAGLDSVANLSGWALSALILGYFLLFWGYFILFETLWNGQTPGKRSVRIRVVKDNGSPVDFFSAATRNLVRIIDFMPSSYAVGVISMFFSPSYKRLGDYAAGTVVVKEYRPEVMREGRKGKGKGRGTKDEGQGRTPEESLMPEESLISGTPEEIPGVTIHGVNAVTREEYDAAHRFLERRGDLPNDVSASFARRIADPILSRLDMTPENPDSYPYDLFLETLARDYLRWQDRGF